MIGVKVTRSKTGPDRGPAWTGPDRTGPVQFGPVLGPPNFLIRSSVRSRSGPVDRWTGPVDRIKWVARSCPSARPDRAPKKIGGTAVPCGTGTPCHFSALSIPRTGPVRSGPGFDRSGPVQDRSQTGPVLGPDLDPYSVLGPDRSGPVRSGPGPNYSPNFSLSNFESYGEVADGPNTHWAKHNSGVNNKSGRLKHNDGLTNMLDL